MEKKQNFDLNYLNKQYKDLPTNVLSDNANVEEAEELKKYKSELIERHKIKQEVQCLDLHTNGLKKVKNHIIFLVT